MTDAEQGGHHPGTPGGGAEDVPGIQEEAELRARLEEEMKKVRVEDLMVQSISGLLNLTARRLAKEDERDLEQARVGIEAIRAWQELLPEDVGTQVRNALAELQMLYAKLVEGGAGGEAPSEGQPGAETPAPEGEPGSGQGKREPPPRLWTPRGS